MFNAQEDICNQVSKDVVVGKAYGDLPVPMRVDIHLKAGSTPITSSMTLYAKWSSKAHKMLLVKFDSLGGSKVKSVLIEMNSPISEPPAPSRDGWCGL